MIDLWKGQSEQMVLKTYLEQKGHEEKARQDAANERLAIYHDDWEDILEDLLAAQFHPENYKNIKITKNTSQNIVKKVVNEVSILYKDPPVRDTGENKILDEIYAYLNIDEFMKRLERYGTLLNDAAIRVGWDADLGKITLDLHTPANTSVMQHDDYPERAKAVYYPIEYIDDKFRAEKKNVYWSDTEHFLFDEKGNAYAPDGNDDMRNPYGVIPFVFLHLEPIPSMFWNKTGGSDLIGGTKIIGMKRTLKDYLFKWQSFKQMWIKSMNAKDIPSEMLSDPSYAMKFWGEGSEIGVLDLQGDFARLDETIKADMNAFLGTYGLSVDMFAASPDESSGRALAFKNRGLREIREGHMPFLRNVEAELCKMIRTVYNAYHGENSIPEIEFSIDYAEMDIYIDPMEKRRQAEWDLQHGLISLAQFYMMFNSDCPDEKTAEKAMMDNTAKTKQMQGKGFDLSKYFGGADQDKEDVTE